MSEKESENGNSKPHLIFAYGTLKQGFPNYALMQDLITKNDAVFIGTFSTRQPYPLVCGPHGIPYLINIPGSGHLVTGELYSVSRRALVRLDEFEGVSLGYYERLPVMVVSDGDGGATVETEKEAEAYFGHRKFGERLWKKNGEVGMREYGEKEAGDYVRKVDRPDKRNTILDQFL
ncbi:hypothetical protein TanjilG_20666 [Lupinus angustifolius]|uniref:Gamma-glutamylcyclotransferase family protein n=1 Tax=Lupinus angustifolius TaxID=3871 RepID=A0A4P1QRP1_LUPAN|nr:PREDICTED: putative gamma-glutamylcyclotransferase At3g02910 [Lupinus angustifolius]OIV93004.1 hypothetical protein TanjilG_20666 [Lupinus angustifolius]